MSSIYLRVFYYHMQIFQYVSFIFAMQNKEIYYSRPW